MEMPLVEDQLYKNADYSQKPLPKGDYERCTFAGCLFAGADLSNINFFECEFRDCDLSTARLNNTALRDVLFKGCKVMGLHFEHCNGFLFTVTFDNCLLNLSTFYRLNLKRTSFKDSRLQEADFTEADLSGSVFDHCNLERATFMNTLLEKADFRTSYNYSMDPELNRIRKAKFSLQGVAGLLNKYDIEIAQ